MKMSKKLLALVLTVAMLVSCMVFSFSADAAVTLLWENDFENGVLLEDDATNGTGNWLHSYTTNGGVCTTQENYAATPTTEGDNTFMRLSYGNYASSNRALGFRVMHEQTTVKNAGMTYGTAGTYTYGSTPFGWFIAPIGHYYITFDYRVGAVGAGYPNALIDICVLLGDVGWSSGKGNAGHKFEGTNYIGQVAATVDKNDTAWQTATIMVEATENSIIHIMTAQNNGSGHTGWSIDIDNIQISNYDPTTDLTSVNYYYGGAQIATSNGLATTAYTMPALSGLPANAEITYWADAEFTTPATIPTVYPAASMDIYIKADPYLTNAPWSFESETVGATISAKSNTTEGGAYVISGDYAHSGSQSAKLQMSQAYTMKGHRNQFFLKNSSGSIARVEYGKSYLFSYWVMVPTTAPQSFKGNLWLAGRGDKTTTFGTGNNLNSTNAFFRDAGDSAYVEVPNDGQWHHVVRYVDSARIASEDWAGNVLVGLSDTVGNENLYVYIDDMDLICVDDLAAGATSREQYLFGETVGDQLTHLHRHSSKQDDAGVYTSVRLGATYTAGDADGDTIVLGGVALPLVERGIVVDAEANAATLSVDSNKWKSAKTSGFDSVWEKNGNDLTYTLRLANIGKALIDAGDRYVYRSYFKVNMPVYKENNGAQTLGNTTNLTITTYGETSTAFSFNDIYTDCTTAPDYAGGVWFE